MRRLRVLAALVLVASAPLALAQGPWLPLEVGRTWTYDYRSERVESKDGEAPATERFRGTLRDHVRGSVPELGPSAVEVVSRLEGSDADGILSSETRRAFLEPLASGYRIHALDATHPVHGTTQLTRYDPPLESLRDDVVVGSTWVVGDVDLGGLKTRLTARVTALEDATTPSGRYEDCLVVRTEGEISGTFEVYAGEAEVTGGRIVVTDWFAPGHGLVRSKEEVVQTVRLPDGTSSSVRERIDYALREEGREPPPGPAAR